MFIFIVHFTIVFMFFSERILSTWRKMAMVLKKNFSASLAIGLGKRSRWPTFYPLLSWCKFWNKIGWSYRLPYTTAVIKRERRHIYNTIGKGQSEQAQTKKKNGKEKAKVESTRSVGPRTLLHHVEVSLVGRKRKGKKKPNLNPRPAA